MRSRFFFRRSLGVGLLGLLLALGVLWRAVNWDDEEGIAIVKTAEELGPEVLSVEAPASGVVVTGEAAREFEFPLAEGEHARIVLVQRGIDLALVVRGPGRDEIFVDSPTGREGEESLSVVAEAVGTFQVRVVSEDLAGVRGEFELRLTERRVASEQDHVRAEAERVFAQGEQARRQELWSEARELYRVAWRLFQTLGDDRAETLARYRLGWVGLEIPEARAEAQADLEASSMRFLALGEKLLAATALNRLGQLHRGEWRLEEAGTSVDQARELFRQLEDGPGLAASWHLLGKIGSSRGDFDGALAAFETARDLYRKADLPKEEAAVLYDLGRLYLSRDFYDEARGLLEAAWAAARRGEDEGTVHAVRFLLGALAQRRGELAVAEEHLVAAAAYYRDPLAPSPEAAALNSLGTLRLKQGRSEEAKATYEEALALARQQRDRREEATALLNLGRWAFEVEQWQTAAEYHRESLKLFDPERDVQAVASSRYGLGRALHRLGRYSEARVHLRAVVDSLEELRGQVRNSAIRTSYLASKRDYWELHIDTLVRLHELEPGSTYDQAALVETERWRARALRETLVSSISTASARGPQSPELEATVAELQAIASAQLGAGRSVALAAREASLVRQLERAKAATFRDPTTRLLEFGAPFDLRAAQKDLLGPYTAALVYSLGPSRSFLWVVTAKEVKLHLLPPRSRIEGLANALVVGAAEIGRPSRARAEEAARGLASSILPPLGLDARHARLVIVPDGALHQVPFAFLPSPDNPEMRLLERFEIVHLPALSVLELLRSRPRIAPEDEGQVAVVADPVFSASDERLHGAGLVGIENGLAPSTVLSRFGGMDLPRLRGSRQEAEVITAGLPLRDRLLLLDFDADRARLLDGDLRGYRWLHFATHGLVHPEHPELSGLALSLFDRQGRPQDGFLQLHEIHRLPMTAELVVLSACDSAQGPIIAGEGMLGLARGFLEAGSQQVVASLWRVDDQAAVEFMAKFYRALRQPGWTAPAALRSAQLELLRADVPPAHWSGFVAVGSFPPEAAVLAHDIEGADRGAPPPPVATGDHDLPPPEPPDLRPPGISP